MSLSPNRARAAGATITVALIAMSAPAAADETVSAARAESFSAARAKCAQKLHQSCYAQRLWHIRRSRCWVFRGVLTCRVGRTYGCPGSPSYVY